MDIPLDAMQKFADAAHLVGFHLIFEGRDQPIHFALLDLLTMSLLTID